MERCIQPDTRIENTGFGYTMSIIGGKYKMIILYWLGEFDVLRHNALHRLIGKISFKMLSSTLKELEADGLIIRTVYPQLPPKVEYSLSAKGKSLIPILFDLCEWGDKNRLAKS
uniref:HxlR family transcriptional regulator n=1 Tax=uncultured Alphaproteobacteria bacterium TaxID=91750 RepID=A0A6G8F2C1_9PROT|nr:HxlR family transcriptional regulator [uncultured Alphaproteobacteria bacterium]